MTSELSRPQMWATTNPLRFRIFELLREGPATASAVARRLGESSGTTSYHLRRLAEAGLVEEDASIGSRRERWWRRRQEQGVLAASDSDPEGRAITARYYSMFFARDAEARRRFMTRKASDEWHQAATAGSWIVAMTPEQAVELGARLFGLIDEYRGRPAFEETDEALVSVSILPWSE